MTVESSQVPSVTPSLTDDDRWRAVLARDPAAEGAFFYSVRTTGVYCRPNCASRPARRENVRFHATAAEAEAAGFRPCLRCHPAGEGPSERQAAAVVRACRAIEGSGEAPSLDELAEAAGLSRHHFHRVFKARTGVTPRAFAAAHRAGRVREELGRSATVTGAIYAAGYSSSGRFYEGATEALGMTPTAFRAGGAGASIRFAIGETWLGPVLVAASEVGLCAIFLGDDPDGLVADLRGRFPKARLIGGDADFERVVAEVVGLVESPGVGRDLPLDILGTAFQRRVWEALRQIPAGSTATYAEIADRIALPKSVRAVAGACAANLLAVAIPCHRVIKADGSLSGYRWGVDRKAGLLRRERGEA